MKNLSLRRVLFPLIVVAALGFSACAFVQSLSERLNILSVNFGFERLDVSGLAYPRNTLEVARDLLSFNAAARGKYGVDVRCRIRARNPNAHPAAFDGAAARLRVQDTAGSAPAAQAFISAFRVAGGGSADLDVVFPVRLDNPIFSKSAWTQVLRGGNIPYRVDADLSFHLLNDSLPEALRSIGNGSVRLSVAKGSVDARETAATAVDLLIKALGLAF